MEPVITTTYKLMVRYDSGEEACWAERPTPAELKEIYAEAKKRATLVRIDFCITITFPMETFKTKRKSRVKAKSIDN